jgi:glycosyltransferase involved in cell wall biosynthesis
MKIGIESQRIFRRNKHGMDVVAMELIRHLQSIDKYNQYVLFAKDGADRNSVPQWPNFEIEILPGMTYADWEQVSLPRAVKRVKPDLLHCTANTAPMRCKVPLVLTLHDIIFLHDVNFKGTSYQNFGNLYRKMVVPYAIRNAQKIITVSEYERSVIVERCKIDPDKIVVIYNAVAESFRPAGDDTSLQLFRKEYQLPRKFMLHLGNTAPKKNTPSLIAAYVGYCNHVDAPLPIVVADYSRELVMRMLRKLNREDLATKFYFPGHIPVDEMPLLYNCCSLFIYPSLEESFGLPVLEAMASGVPVLASSIPALQEVCGDAAQFVDPRDVSAISAAIADILSSEKKQHDYVQKGLLRAQSFNWRKSAEQLLQIYKNI